MSELLEKAKNLIAICEAYGFEDASAAQGIGDDLKIGIAELRAAIALAKGESE